MLTIIIGPQMYLSNESNDVDSLEIIHDAIINFVNQLAPNDYICFNIGNKDTFIRNDNQSNMKHYEQVLNNFGWIKDKISNKEIWDIILGLQGKNNALFSNKKNKESFCKKYQTKILKSLKMWKDAIYLGIFIMIFKEIAFNSNG